MVIDVNLNFDILNIDVKNLVSVCISVFEITPRHCIIIIINFIIAININAIYPSLVKIHKLITNAFTISDSTQ